MSNRIVEIDQNSGFCFGVKNAIEMAEKSLVTFSDLSCLGDIVHNDSEVDRLRKKGMQTIEHNAITTLGEKQLFIRAHGEPPSTYQLAKENGVQVIDATCPVVLKLQSRVKLAYQKSILSNGTVLIYGKKNHAEVNGLMGQTNGNALVIESPNDLEGVDFSKPIYLFAQTTKSIESFNNLVELIEGRVLNKEQFEFHDTICRQVSNRVPLIKAFAQRFSLILFVGGKNSSNAQVLFKSCQLVNPNSYFVSEGADIQPHWFNDSIHSVGVCGATSTPLWLMEAVAQRVRNEF